MHPCVMYESVSMQNSVLATPPRKCDRAAEARPDAYLVQRQTGHSGAHSASDLELQRPLLRLSSQRLSLRIHKHPAGEDMQQLRPQH